MGLEFVLLTMCMFHMHLGLEFVLLNLSMFHMHLVENAVSRAQPKFSRRPGDLYLQHF